MVKRMLIDATHPEETRVVVLDGTRLEEFDVETSTKKQIKGNIYLAKVVRVEPSLQAAFVDYGGNRHGFLAFSEIHPDYYQIPVADRERLMAEANRHHDEEEQRQARRHDTAQGRASHAEDHDQDHGHDQEHDHEHHDHDDHGQDGHGQDVHGHHQDGHDQDGHHEVPLAFIPPAITAEITPDEPHDDAPVAASDEHHDDEGPEPQRGVIEEIEPVATAETITEVGGDAPTAEAGVGESGALENNTDENGRGEVLPPQAPAHVETVGGDEEDEEASAADSQRRRFVASRHYKIQEVIKRRQIMLIQVVKEERGNKGAALTTFLSLAGRYCVLMPNSARGGGVSRKITSAQDRRRLKQIVGDLELPQNMAVILRTAGAERNKAEIKRDYEYLQRTWNQIREVTMGSRAPALIHEEASLIKRAIRDIYSRDIEEIWVEGEEGYKVGKDFMKTLTPSHAKKVQRYKDDIIPLFHRYQVETQMEGINSPVVQLRSGGSIVFAQTEALVAIDVNSGRATKERHIEETAYKTNMEAAEEIARQLRLRDLAGLIVIDFIDMEDNRNNHAVERKLKESLKADRARIQVGRISHFGLLELSRQRLRPSLIETNFRVCAHCAGSGMVRSTESAAVHSLRMLEEEGVRRRSSEVTLTTHPDVAIYLLNYKREMLASIEARYSLKVLVLGDPHLIPPNLRIDRIKAAREDGEYAPEREALPAPLPMPMPVVDEDDSADEEQPREHHRESHRDGGRDGAREGHRDSGREGGREGHRDRGRGRDRDRNRDRDPNRDSNREANRDPNREQPNREQPNREQPNREQQGHDGAPRDDKEGGGRKRRRRRRRGGSGEGRDRNDGQQPPDENRDIQAQANPDAGVLNDGETNGDEQGFTPVEGQAELTGGERDESRRRRRGRRGGRRRRRGGEGGEQAGGEQTSGEQMAGERAVEAHQGRADGHDGAGAPAASAITYDAPRIEQPAAASRPEESAPHGDEATPGGASRFFRAIKSRLRGDSAEDNGRDEAAPAAAPAPQAAPVPEEPSGPKRGGWWQNPNK